MKRREPSRAGTCGRAILLLLLALTLAAACGRKGPPRRIVDQPQPPAAERTEPVERLEAAEPDDAAEQGDSGEEESEGVERP